MSVQQMQSRLAPPFSNEVRALLARGGRPNLFLHMGSFAWERAKRREPGHRCALPPGDDPAIYDWSGFRGLHITLVAWQCSEDEIKAVGAELIRAGASLVMAIDPEGNMMRFVPRRATA